MTRGEVPMKTLLTLATLLLGLAVVFWAPAAKADCPHNDDDTHQHCGGGASTSNEFRRQRLMLGIIRQASPQEETTATIGQSQQLELREVELIPPARRLANSVTFQAS